MLHFIFIYRLSVTVAVSSMRIKKFNRMDVSFAEIKFSPLIRRYPTFPVKPGARVMPILMPRGGESRVPIKSGDDYRRLGDKVPAQGRAYVTPEPDKTRFSSRRKTCLR